MVDLFAGPGGLDVAARWLGITVDGIEWDANACATREEAGLRTTQGDVRDYEPEQFSDATILAGGPPCQTYTVAGGGAGRRALERVLDFVKRMEAREDISQDLSLLDAEQYVRGEPDVRTGLVIEPLRWALRAVDAGRPYEAIVLEQVPAVLPVWEAVADVLAGEGYNAVFDILHTEEFGVPQTRRRAILIARHNSPAELPRPTHRRYRKGMARSEGDPRLRPWESMGAALKRREKFVVVSNYGTGGDPKARGQRESDHPAATVTGKVSRNRLVTSRGIQDRFTLAEAGRLQTFPLDYPWAGKDRAQQIGNAIPPRLAVHVLAASMGRRPIDATLDEAVEGKWDDTSGSAPVLTEPLPTVTSEKNIGKQLNLSL